MMIQETYYLKQLVIETVDILNADFEFWDDQTLNDWQVYGHVLKTSGHNGSIGVLLDQDFSISQTCKITGGNQYELRAWAQAVIGIYQYFVVSVSFDHGAGYQFNGIGQSVWSEWPWHFTVPEDATEVTFSLSSGPVRVDDVSCVLVE